MPKPKAALRSVKAAAKSNPAIAREVAAFEQTVSEIPELRVVARQAPPALTDLDATARKQLEAAATSDGERFTAAQILAGDVEDIDPKLIERLQIGGTDSYDGWRVSLDTGAFFRAGSLEIVASIVQGSIDCSDPTLTIALRDALASRASKPRRTPKKPATTRRKRSKP